MGDRFLEEIWVVENKLCRLRLRKTELLLNLMLDRGFSGLDRVLHQLDFYILTTENQLDSLNKSIASAPLQQFEEQDDSLDQELIPLFFFDEKEYPITDVEEDFIPWFFFHEENDDSTGVVLNTIPTSDVYAFERKNQIGLSKCFSIFINSSYSLFDRGKAIEGSLVMPNYIVRIVYELFLKHGYRFSSIFMDSIASLLGRNGAIVDIANLFGKMSARERNLFEIFLKNVYQLGLLLANSIGILPTNEGEDCYNCKLFDPDRHTFHGHRGCMTLLLDGSDCNKLLRLKGSSRGIEIMKGCPDAVRNDFLLQTQLRKVSCKFINDECVFPIIVAARKTFDRGKFFKFITRYSSSNASRSHFGFGMLSYCLIVSNGLILMGKLDEVLILQIIVRLGYQSDVGFLHSIVHLCTNGVESHDAVKLFIQMSGRNRVLISLLAWRVIKGEAHELPVNGVVWCLHSGRDDFILQHKTGKLSYNLLVGECLYYISGSTRGVFDSGKGIELIQGFPQLMSNTYEFYVSLFNFCSLILNVRSYFYLSRIRFFLLSLRLINEVYGKFLLFERRPTFRLHSLMWVKYLRWKFKLFPPGLWSWNGGEEGDVLHILLKELTFLTVFIFSRIVLFFYFYFLISEVCEGFSITAGYSNLNCFMECNPWKVESVDMAVQFSVLSHDEKGYYRSKVLSEEEVHTQIESTFMRLPSWQFAATSGLFRMGNDTVTLGGCLLLSDSSKWCDSILWSSYSKLCNCPGTSEGFNEIIQAHIRQRSTKVIKYPPWMVSPTYIYLQACGDRLLWVFIESDYFDRTFNDSGTIWILILLPKTPGYMGYRWLFDKGKMLEWSSWNPHWPSFDGVSVYNCTEVTRHGEIYMIPKQGVVGWVPTAWAPLSSFMHSSSSSSSTVILLICDVMIYLVEYEHTEVGVGFTSRCFNLCQFVITHEAGEQLGVRKILQKFHP